MRKIYGVELSLLYGSELFAYFTKPQVWENILKWLKTWQNSLPELPEINFDADSQSSFNEIKELEIRYWRKLLENERLWQEGIIKAISREGATLKLIFEFFKSQELFPYKKLADLLDQRLKKFYEIRNNL